MHPGLHNHHQYSTRCDINPLISRIKWRLPHTPKKEKERRNTTQSLPTDSNKLWAPATCFTQSRKVPSSEWLDSKHKHLHNHHKIYIIHPVSSWRDVVQTAGKGKSATEQSHATFFFSYLVITLVFLSVCRSYSFLVSLHNDAWQVVLSDCSLINIHTVKTTSCGFYRDYVRDYFLAGCSGFLTVTTRLQIQFCTLPKKNSPT